MSEALIIFVRNPELGKVKTRLAATLGSEKALHIYQELLAHTLFITKNIAAEKYIFYAGEIAENDIWNNAGFHKLLQKEANLGEKMSHAFETLFNKNHSKVIIIGSDCIELTGSIIQEAFQQLNKHEVVIGPANDGGYYLLGMKKLHAELFENKKWSTEHVYTATIMDLEASAASFHELPVLIDIDTEADWLAANEKIKDSTPR